MPEQTKLETRGREETSIVVGCGCLIFIPPHEMEEYVKGLGYAAVTALALLVPILLYGLRSF